MFVTTALAILAVLSTSVGVWDKITSPIRKTVIAASILVTISVLSQVVQVVDKRGQEAKLAQQQKIIRDQDIFLKSNLGAIDEASGGDIYGDLAYVVDDEVPAIFVLKYLDSQRKYIFNDANSKPIKIVDARPCAERLDWNQGCTNDSEPTELTYKLLEDLEGAAVYNNKLYLTTSQSIDKGEEPQRWLFLELSFDGKVIRATRKIRAAIVELFKGGVHGTDMSNKLGEVEVEGLAIDNNGIAYLGFRSPLVDGKALVLRTPVENLFTDKPSFEPFLLVLEQGANHYGITSLDYDPKRNEILVLSNSPMKTRTLPPILWSWTVTDSKLAQSPEPYQGEIVSDLANSGSRPPKPEVVLLPEENRIHLFFDAQGNGGQVNLVRDGNKLSRSDVN